jgi:hypothetical protein
MTELIQLTMLARALDMPSDSHPNRMPFSGVLTRIDEPSDGAPEGSGGKRVMLTKAVAEKALDSLLGMGVNYNPEGHSPREKVGIIEEARIEGNSIWVKGYIFAADFPEVAAEIKANKNVLGMSFEAKTLLADSAEADQISITYCIFTGAAILLKYNAAYKSTSISASSNNNGNTMSSDILAQVSASNLRALNGENRPTQTIAAAAANPDNFRRLKELKAMSRRLRCPLKDNAPIDLVELDSSLKASGASLEDRFAFKALLGQLHLIA